VYTHQRAVVVTTIDADYALVFNQFGFNFGAACAF
jgi:hypothetical protein